MSIDEAPEQLDLARKLEVAGARIAMRIGPAEIPLVNDMMLTEPFDDPLIQCLAGRRPVCPRGLRWWMWTGWTCTGTSRPSPAMACCAKRPRNS